MLRTQPEILAPAGSFEALEAAVRCGADAVYLGGGNFSARQNAANFDAAALARAVEYAHLRSVKIYQAVNTLVFDSQLEELLQTVRHAAEIGVDALILQDLGAVRLIRQAAPDMPLHASTQMTLHTPQGVLLAKEMGFSRAVAARELSKNQIQSLCGLGIEIEAFVHGALCMSVSGQCYMSAMIGSRSANRGLCAQACRLPFSAVPGQERSDLSLKDLSLVPALSELADMGVASLKIEGRMKRPEYVAAAVTACRAALDGREPDIDMLRAVFSRGGFTDGYFRNRLGKDMFGVRERDDVKAAGEVLPQLSELYKKDIKSDTIQFEIEIKENQSARLTVSDGAGHMASAEGDIPQRALNRPSDMEQAEKQLAKLGDTVYSFGGVSGVIQEGLMLPASAFNALRRTVVDRLDKIRIEENKPKYTIRNIVTNSFVSAKIAVPTFRLELRHAEQLLQMDAAGAEKILLPLDEVFKHREALLPFSEKLMIMPPRFMPGTEPEVENRLRVLKEAGFFRLYCMNPAHIRTGQALGFCLHGGFGLNAANSAALGELSAFGLEDTVVSFELKASQIIRMGNELPVGILAYGRLPLMLTRNCPIQCAVGCKDCTGRLTDRTGRSFSVVCDGTSAEILNSETLWLPDRLREFPAVAFFQLKFNEETPQRIQEVLRQYAAGENQKPAEFTRGLYYRGIQ